MEQTTKKYCYGCKKRHDEESWRWKSKKLDGKTIWWCHECIDCYGCKVVHHNDTGRTRIDSRGQVCGKWWKSTVSMDQKIKNMSSEEVLSGVQYGNPNQFSTVSEDRTPDVVQKERKQVLEALQ